MNLAERLALGSLLTGMIQIVVGVMQLYPARSRRSIPGALLIVGSVSAFVIAASLYWHPASVTVDKPCPVIQQQTGDATTKGSQSPASSGNDNSVTYGTAAPAASTAKPKR